MPREILRLPKVTAPVLKTGNGATPLNDMHWQDANKILFMMESMMDKLNDSQLVKHDETNEQLEKMKIEWYKLFNMVEAHYVWVSPDDDEDES